MQLFHHGSVMTLMENIKSGQLFNLAQEERDYELVNVIFTQNNLI